MFDLSIGASAMNDTTQFGTSQDPVLLHSARCNGNEENLLRCMLNSETLGDTHDTDAGVWCQLKRKKELLQHVEATGNFHLKTKKKN